MQPRKKSSHINLTFAVKLPNRKQKANLDQTTGEKRLQTHKHGHEKSCHNFLLKFPKASSRAGSDMVKR